MEFTLRYRGPLPPHSVREKRVPEKQSVRRHIHAQLETLWATDPRLVKINPKTLQASIRKGAAFDVQRPIVGDDKFFYRYSLGGFDFIPLINTPSEARCHLAIRLYCANAPGNIIFDGGDLDNRLKTLFDALRMPLDEDQLGESAATNGETLFCLLESDRLITKVSVESIRLLGPIPEDRSYAELDIDVTVLAVTPMMGTIGLLYP